MTDERITQAVAAAAIGFGITGLLTPRQLARFLGFDTETGESRYLMRIAAIEDFGLGMNLLMAREEERRRLLAIASTIDAVCCIFAVASALSNAMPRRAAIMMGGVTAVVAASAALPLLRQRPPGSDRPSSTSD